MRIKTKGKSPTVIVIEQGTMDEDKNSLAFKRMDSLERKIDNQYKAVTDKKQFIKMIDTMQKSFTKNLDKVVTANKSALSDSHKKRISSLRSEFKATVDSLKNKSTSDTILKSFASRLGSLETSVKSIPRQNSTVKVVRTGMNLNKAFDTLFIKMQELIGKSGPRMIPSPS